MAERVEAATLDVSGLPTVVFGTRSVTWLGIMGLMAIEGMVFMLTIATYFYLHSRSVEWYRRRARVGDTRAVQIGLVIMTLIGIAIIVVRYFELLHLNTDWSIDAYGSAVWTLIGLHVVHLLTDTVDTVVLAVLFFTSMIEGKRFMDAAENADYWYFVIVTWIPIYLVIYWAPRWLHA